MKIAPDIRTCLDMAWESRHGLSNEVVPRADRQLRALLAVARAANDAMAGKAGWIAHLRRALAHLEKASKP